MVVAAVVAILVCVAVVVLSRVRRSAQQTEDSTQIRGLHQGMVLWRQSNDDSYPLPSLLDRNNDTVAATGGEKNTTANIMSILIYNGFVGTEVCIALGETNPNIRAMKNYSFKAPARAANPAKALWDPAFAADFTGGNIGNFSYAHMLPADERLKKTWKDTFQASEAVLGNRGPQVTSMGVGPDGARRSRMAISDSNTLRIHGSSAAWAGNVAYNDNHIGFEISMAPTQYKDGPGKAWSDCLFFDEPDDPKRTNNFLGIFTKAGATGAEYRAIWD
jgi:hypothetical protein